VRGRCDDELREQRKATRKSDAAAKTLLRNVAATCTKKSATKKKKKRRENTNVKVQGANRPEHPIDEARFSKEAGNPCCIEQES
jgi:hypothetical protein